MEIESRQIRYLAAVGEHGTFINAAKALRISQPALSLSIQRLEDIVKTPLVERGRNGAKLTEAGRLLARRSQEVDNTMQAAIAEIELLSHGISGKLRVGGTPLSTSSIIPAVISKILNHSQDVAIDIAEAVDEDLLDQLETGQLDIVISALAPPNSCPGLDFVPLFEAKTVLAMRKGHPLSRHESLSLASLENALWAMPSAGGTFRNQIEALFTTSGLSFPEKTIQTASIATLLRAVRMSDAISLVSEQLILDDLAQGTLSCVQISHSLAPRIIGLYTHNDRIISNLGRLFQQISIDIAPQFETENR